MVHDVLLVLLYILVKMVYAKLEYFSSVQDFLVSYVCLVFFKMIKDPTYTGILSTIN